jgi:hypothetical protein
MIINSKTLAVLLVALLFGGILGSSALGWWQTESTKEPVKFTEGEFAGQANPADIRGSYTFADIAKSFDVTPEVLAQAFEVPAGQDAAAFQVKSLEEIYAGSGYEVGTASVRLFVAFYAGLPYDLTTAETTYLPKPAADILTQKGGLTPEQTAYIETHTVPVEGNAPPPRSNRLPPPPPWLLRPVRRAANTW